MSANSANSRGANHLRLLRESAFVLLLSVVFGMAYAASAFDFRRSELRAAAEVQEAVAKQLSQAKGAIAEIAEREGRFSGELFASVGVSASELREANQYPPDLTRVLLQQEAARDAWAHIVNCPATSPVVADAEALVGVVSARAKFQNATQVDRQTLAVMLADLSTRLEAVKARAKNLDHVRFMVEADRLESPGSK